MSRKFSVPKIKLATHSTQNPEKKIYKNMFNMYFFLPGEGKKEIKKNQKYVKHNFHSKEMSHYNQPHAVLVQQKAS